MFCSYHCRNVKKPDNMIPKVVKAGFKILMKIYKDYDAKFEITIATKIWNSFLSIPFLLHIETSLLPKRRNVWNCPSTILLPFFKFYMLKKPPIANNTDMMSKKNWSTRKQTERRTKSINTMLHTSAKLLFAMINQTSKHNMKTFVAFVNWKGMKFCWVPASIIIGIISSTKNQWDVKVIIPVTNWHCDDCGGQDCIAPVPEAALGINKTTKIGITNLFLFKGISMNHTPIVHTLLIETTMLVQACHLHHIAMSMFVLNCHPQHVVTTLPLSHTWNTCIKKFNVLWLPSILVARLHQKYVMMKTVWPVLPKIWPVKQTPMALAINAMLDLWMDLTVEQQILLKDRHHICENRSKPIKQTIFLTTRLSSFREVKLAPYPMGD